MVNVGRVGKLLCLVSGQMEAEESDLHGFFNVLVRDEKSNWK